MHGIIATAIAPATAITPPSTPIAATAPTRTADNPITPTTATAT